MSKPLYTPYKREVSEDVEQIHLFQWAVMQECTYPQLKLMYHVANGKKRDKKTGAILKMMGVKKGVPDVCLPISRQGYHGLYFELKANNKNTTTEEQDEWIEALSKEGYKTAVCRGADEAIKLVLDYLKG